MYSIAITTTDKDTGESRTDYCTGNTRRTCLAAAASCARLEELEGNTVVLGSIRKER